MFKCQHGLKLSYNRHIFQPHTKLRFSARVEILHIISTLVYFVFKPLLLKAILYRKPFSSFKHLKQNNLMESWQFPEKS